MPEPRIFVEASGARFRQLIDRAKVARSRAKTAQQESRRLEEMLNAATPNDKPFAVELENDVPLE